MAIPDSITVYTECPNCHRNFHKTVSSTKPARPLDRTRGMKTDPRFLPAHRSRETEQALQQQLEDLAGFF